MLLSKETNLRRESCVPHNHKRLGNLAPVGLDDQEISVLEAVLTLGASRLNHAWKISEVRADSFLLVKVDGSGASTLRWHELVQTFGTECLIALGPSEVEVPAQWRLAARPGDGIGLQALVNVLNALGAETELPLSETPPVPLINGLAPGRFDPAEHFTSLVESACARGVNTYWEHESLGIYCCPSEQVFFSRKNLESLLPLLLAKRSEIAEILIGDTPTAAQFREEGWKRHDLLELRWFAALVASKGRIGIAIDPAEPLHLGTMPEWVRLPYYAEYAAIAKHMASAAEPMAKIAATTGHTEGEVANFANACDTLGLLIRNRDAVEIAGFQQAARQRIKSLFCRHFKNLAKNHLKLVFTGSVGAGKTTTIGLLSDYPIVLTESRPSDNVRQLKRTTTVAMDYGSIVCNRASKVHLYGTPGQRRFEFMGQILARSSWAIVIFISNGETDPLGELKYYLDQYRQFADTARIVVAVTHYDRVQRPAIAEYEKVVSAQGLDAPVVVADPRTVSGLVEIFERLF
jgi:signal recognition particle receptor subunit beta